MAAGIVDRTDRPDSAAGPPQQSPPDPVDPTPVIPPPTPQGGQVAPTPAAQPAPEQVISPPQPEPEPEVEPQQMSLPAGVYTLRFPDSNEADAQATLPLSLQGDSNAFGRPIEAQVEILEAELAGDLSPVGLAFTVNFTVTNGQDDAIRLADAQTPPELVIDYSQLPLRYGGNFAERLTVYQVSNCDIPPESEPATAAPVETEGLLACQSWQPLPSQNKTIEQQLVVSLVELTATQPLSKVVEREPLTDTIDLPAPKAEPTHEAPPAPEHERSTFLYLPLVNRNGKGKAPTTPLPDGPFYVVASGAVSSQSDYSATPLANVDTYEVGLFSGAMQTGYDIPLPPAVAGSAPSVSLSYDSGNIDGMNSAKNNQPGWVGIGWSLTSGSIVRHLKTCNLPQSYAAGDLCLTGDNFSITLNGTTLRLIKQSGNLYTLQNDPRWKVEMVFDTSGNHPDSQGEYWWVTTPDGTRYRFGGETEPETGADQNSGFYAPVYDYTTPYCGSYAYDMCDKVYRWNLDRVEDPNGNVISFFYDHEYNYYKARGDSRQILRKQYVRAGHLSRIEYTKRAGQTVQPHAQVLFNTELRCDDPTTMGGCDWPADFPDTPGDLACEYSGSCSQDRPTFWSQRKLDAVQTQIYDADNSRWKTVGLYDLSQAFPTPPADGQGDTSERKLWLESITQRPGGDFSFTAFSQLEAEKRSSESGVSVSVEEAQDAGRGGFVTDASNGDFLRFNRVDFGSGANTVLVRLAASATGGMIEFRFDSSTGTKIAEFSVSATGGEQSWTTESVTVSGASGIHDLYIVFNNTSDNVNLNWFRFKPSSGLPGLPAVTYDYDMLPNKRNYDLAYVSPMYMPRIDQVTTELGGQIDVTYGQSHPCPTSAPSYIRLPYDCFVAWDVGDPNLSYDDGWHLWHKWKVTQLQQSDSFSNNPTQTTSYSYSTPAWHYSDDPSLPDINSCSNCPTRHWNDFRGHPLVTVTDSAGVKTEHRFYQGMDGDRLNVSGGSYSASISLSDSSTRTDHNWLRGQAAETRVLSSDDSVLERTVNWFEETLTAGSGVSGAYFVGLDATESTRFGTTTKSRRTEYDYDSYGNLTLERQLGDISTGSDDRTLERSYLYNTTAYIVDRPEWEKLWAGVAPGSSGTEKAYVAYGYDNQAIGTTPTVGNVTLVRAYHQAAPSYAYYDTTMSYDSYGRPQSVTDANNQTATTAYHSFYGYVTRVTNPLNHVTTTEHDPGWGVVTSLTDSNNHTAVSQYDAYGRLKKVWLPTEATSGPASYEFNYAPSLRPAYVHSKQLFQAGSSTYLEQWRYVDGFGREIQNQRASTNSGQRVVSSSEYDNRGQLAYQSIPYEISGAAGSGYAAPIWTGLNSYRRYVYDPLGRQIRDELWYQSSRKWYTEDSYDGWLRSHKNENLRQTDYRYDAFEQLVEVKEYNSGGATYTTAYAYDYQGNLTQVTDNAGHVTTMSYDLLGRKTTMTDPDMGSWSYSYDGNGNLTEQTDGRGLKLALAYDALNRLTAKRQDSSSGTLIAEYLYDASGQKGLLSISKAHTADGIVQVDYVAYDARNRLTEKLWTVPGIGGGAFRLGWSYDEADHITAVTYPHDTSLSGLLGETVTRSYNTVGQFDQMISQSDNTHYVASSQYTPDGLPAWQRYDQGANGAERSWGYYAADRRLATLNAGSGGGTTNRQSVSYLYDPAGNITRIKDYRNSTQRQCFQYDYLNRLTRAFTANDDACSAYSTVGTGPYDHDYDYDSIGNLTDYDGAAYSYGGSQPHAVTAAHGNSYGYDSNGNQTTRTIGGTTYTLVYDYENRLTEIKQGSTVIGSFIYDVDGNRVKGTVGGVTTVYIEGLFEYQDGGGRTHYYGGAAMRRLGYSSDNGIFYLLQDHLSSTSVILDQAGAVQASHFYYPYGGNRNGAYSSLISKRFTGQYHEASLPGSEGLYYYNARWYDAQLGRFAQADNIISNPGNPQTFNRYSYVLNNPTRYIDPTGNVPTNPNWDIKPFPKLEPPQPPQPPQQTYTPSRSIPSRSTQRSFQPNSFYPRSRPLSRNLATRRPIRPQANRSFYQNSRRWPDAVAWRFDVSAGLIMGADLNIDAVWRLPKGLRYGSRGFTFEKPGAVDVFVAPGLQILDFGFGSSTGPAAIWNLPTLEDYTGHTTTLGGSIFEGSGAEGNYFWSPGSDVWGLHGGGGMGGEYFIGVGYNHTWYLEDFYNDLVVPNVNNVVGTEVLSPQKPWFWKKGK